MMRVGSSATSRKPATRKRLPPVLPPLDPDPALIAAISLDTGLDAAIVRGWLAGERRVSGHLRDLLLQSLWKPLGGWHG